MDLPILIHIFASHKKKKTINPMSKNKLKRAMDAKRVIVVNERTIKDKSGNVKIISTIAPLNGGRCFNAPPFNL